jgi:signal transduction histidine kinase
VVATSVQVTAVLQWVQAALFAALAIATAISWWRHRSAPTAYAAAGFGALGVATVSARVTEAAGVTLPEVVADVRTAAVVAFPWLLAAFAWSFTGRLPSWLRTSGVLVGALAGAAFALPPLADTADRGELEQVYVAAVLVIWLLLTAAAAAHLWVAGRGQRVVRTRTRLLALGAIVLALALLVAGLAGDSTTLAVVTALATIVAALLFAAGVAPPTFLRLYWRQLPNARWHAMQTDLIAATTPQEAAEAVVPILSETFGGGALCVGSDGRVIASAGLAEADAVELAERIVDGRTDPSELEVVPADRWHLAVQTSPYAPLFGEDEQGLLRRFAGQLRLATQRAALYLAHREAREEVEASSRELQALLIGLAHDLRSPAVTISTYAALIGDADDEADRALMVDGLRDGSAYLERLVDGLTSLSRIGRNDGEPEPVPLRDVVTGVTRRLHASHPEIRVQVEGELPVIHVDRLRIEQVVDNLIGNAAKHGGRDDLTVTVSWAADEDGGLLTIADDGRGIGESERESVFGLFRRGTTTASGSGVGLGLVRRIVDHLGGTIQVAPSDRGARLEVRIPRAAIVADGPPPGGTAPYAVDPTATDGATVHPQDAAARRDDVAGGAPDVHP